MSKKLALISFFLLGLSSISIANTNTNDAKETNEKFAPLRVLTVSGNGRESIPATLSNINLSIEITAVTAFGAQKEAARHSNAVIEYLQSQKADKLKTSNITLNPRYEYENNKQPKLVGYTALNGINFQISQDKAGIILDESIRLGASRISSIDFSADTTSVEKAKHLAINKAVKDAKQKANTALSALNFNIKDIISIRIDSAEPVRPMPLPIPRMMNAYAAKAAADSSPVIGGDEDIEANVTLDIAY